MSRDSGFRYRAAAAASNVTAFFTTRFLHGKVLLMIRVLVAEDQAMVRGALAALLAREPDIKIVAEVASGDAVLPAALETMPDVALLDIEMPGCRGLRPPAELHTRCLDARCSF